MERSFYIEKGNDGFYAWTDINAQIGQHGKGSTEILAILDLCLKLSGQREWDIKFPNIDQRKRDILLRREQ